MLPTALRATKLLWFQVYKVKYEVTSRLSHIHEGKASSTLPSNKALLFEKKTRKHYVFNKYLFLLTTVTIITKTTPTDN